MVVILHCFATLSHCWHCCCRRGSSSLTTTFCPQSSASCACSGSLACNTKTDYLLIFSTRASRIFGDVRSSSIHSLEFYVGLGGRFIVGINVIYSRPDSKEQKHNWSTCGGTNLLDDRPAESRQLLGNGDFEGIGDSTQEQKLIEAN